MKNAYNDWADYRRIFTDYIINNSDRDLSFNESDNLRKINSIAIIGAGRCNDIDLARLAELFDEITLIDIDNAALEECISLQAESVKEKIKTDIISINGLYENDTEVFCNELLSYVRKSGRALNEGLYGQNHDELKKKTVEGIKILSERLPEKSFDVVVCNGVYSQLLSMYSFFIRSVSQSISDELGIDVSDINKTIEKKLSNINAESVPDINKVLTAAAKKMIVFGNEFSENNKVEGAAVCIDDIRKNYKPDEIIMKWNFNSRENKSYNMLVQKIKKTML